KIIEAAWETGDPGVIFLDRINETQPTPHVGDIEATNPCGEQPLLPYESCTLGSINLSNMIEDGVLDEEKLKRTTELAVHFLDNVIDINKYPLPEIEQITKANRKIGLGVMGYADALLKQNIKYDSDEALAFAERTMEIISEGAKKCSQKLAKERGVFPNFPGSRLEEKGDSPQRNATLLTIAPTGTISLLASCSSGIEPLYAISYERSFFGKDKFRIDNPLFVERAKEEGWYSETMMKRIALKGDLKEIPDVPPDVAKVYRTAFEVSPEWHVRVQSMFQRFSDNAVSKTVNIPENASLEDVRKAFDLAYKLGCKGVTVFRSGCKSCGQVLTITSREQ
ncbi:ribonucleotide-diphosphate reductase subunit alpha, partial [Bdellovibrionota bacterium]